MLLAAQGVTVTTITAGDGKTYPKKGDRLTMHYIGKLASDGTVFDSSVDKGKPFSFMIGIGQVIKCVAAIFSRLPCLPPHDASTKTFALIPVLVPGAGMRELSR